MKIIEQHEVVDFFPGEKFRTYAQRNFKNIYPSNKSIKKAIKRGLFKINDQTAGTGTPLEKGDLIEIYAETPEIKSSSKIILKVIYEDDFFALIDKPSGIPVHSHGKHNIFNISVAQLQKCDLPDALPQPQPAHRLDSLTGGLLMIAKNRSFQVEIGKQFEEKRISKRYTAIVLGQPSFSGIIDFPVDEKEAVTRIEVLESIQFQSWGWLSLVHLYPQTGRTHQLRIHCAKSGFPVFGERKYGQHIRNISGKGLFLFADKLKFEHPVTSEQMDFEIPLPKKFLKYFPLR